MKQGPLYTDNTISVIFFSISSGVTVSWITGGFFMSILNGRKFAAVIRRFFDVIYF